MHFREQHNLIHCICELKLPAYGKAAFILWNIIN